MRRVEANCAWRQADPTSLHFPPAPGPPGPSEQVTASTVRLLSIFRLPSGYGQATVIATSGYVDSENAFGDPDLPGTDGYLLTQTPPLFSDSLGQKVKCYKVYVDIYKHPFQVPFYWWVGAETWSSHQPCAAKTPPPLLL